MTKPTAKTQTSISTTPAEAHSLREQEMRRLSMVMRALSAVLLALGARMLITGAAPISALITALIAALLLAAILLMRHGRKLGPARSARAALLPKHPTNHGRQATSRVLGVSYVNADTGENASFNHVRGASPPR